MQNQQSSKKPAANTTTNSIADIIAKAVIDSGASVITHVPGHGINLIDKHIVSYNEEVAYTIAHGAAMAGSRAATVFKSHGFVKAGNSVLDSLFAGTTAGFVNIITHDKHGEHSDSIFDIRSYLNGIDFPIYEITSDNL